MVSWGKPFKRTINEWSLDNFNEGYVDNRGRFRVYVPNHLRAYKGGYIFRSIVAYEIYHGITVPKEYDIHHIDGNKLNDSKENLEMILHGKHTVLHNINPDLYITRICENCKIEFKIKWFKLKDTSSGCQHRGRFCSQKCYQLYPKSQESGFKTSKSLKLAYSENRHSRREHK
jgi:hypothetical protein